MYFDQVRFVGTEIGGIAVRTLFRCRFRLLVEDELGTLDLRNLQQLGILAQQVCKLLLAQGDWQYQTVPVCLLILAVIVERAVEPHRTILEVVNRVVVVVQVGEVLAEHDVRVLAVATEEQVEVVEHGPLVGSRNGSCGSRFVGRLLALGICL